MIKSVRWRMQIWHASVLALALVLFGSVVYALQWRTRLQQIDAELDRTAIAVGSQLRRLLPFPRRRDDGLARIRPESRFTGPPAETLAEDAPRGRGRGRGGRDAGERFFPWMDSGHWTVPGLPEELEQIFAGADGSTLYCAVWWMEGKELYRSPTAPADLQYPGQQPGPHGIPVREWRSAGSRREVVHAPPFGFNIVVGKSLDADLTAQRRAGWLLAGIGISVLGIGLAGGWWSATRITRPIAQMAATAESISAQNLSARIDVHQADDEVSRLAAVLNRTLDRLQQAFEYQGRFTADASHELRTPLAVVMSHIDLSLARPRTGEEYRASLEACRRASLRMKGLIESLLLLARFDAGQGNLSLQEVDLEQMAFETLELIRPLADSRRVRVAIDAEPLRISADPARLSQVLLNLLTNAVRYNRDGGEVRVKIATEADFAVMTVADSGVGIPEADLPHVFERFYRADRARSQTEGGVGLGLAICQTIVAAHQGAISVRANQPEGTIVEVRLPLPAPRS